MSILCANSWITTLYASSPSVICASSHDNTTGPPSHASPLASCSISCTTPSSSSTVLRITNSPGYTITPTQPRYNSRLRFSTGRQACTAMATIIASVRGKSWAVENSFSAIKSVVLSRRRARSASSRWPKNGRRSSVVCHSASSMAYLRSARSRRFPLISRVRKLAMRSVSFFRTSVDLFLPEGEHTAANRDAHQEIEAVQRSQEVRLLRDRTGDGRDSKRVGIDGRMTGRREAVRQRACGILVLRIVRIHGLDETRLMQRFPMLLDNNHRRRRK